MNTRWQTYFMRVAREIAKNSRCLSRQIGVVLVRDNTLISTGYNGPPRGIPPCPNRWEADEHFQKLKEELLHNQHLYNPDFSDCPRRALGHQSGEGLYLCPAVHAEVNAIANAAKEGISVKYSTMLMTCGVPCRNCLATIVNAGISTIIVSSLELYDRTSDWILTTSDLQIRLYEGE